VRQQTRPSAGTWVLDHLKNFNRSMLRLQGFALFADA
jgi:hypothetical protein